MNTSIQRIYNELLDRKLDVRHASVLGGTFLAFKYNGKVRTISGVNSDLSSSASRTICDNKHITDLVAGMIGIATPDTTAYVDSVSAEAFLKRHTTIVVKPADGAHGNGITTNITTIEQLEAAITKALQYSISNNVLLQQQVKGDDYRVLVLDGEVIAAAERVPASVTGDGASTIAALIEHENVTNPDRGIYYEKPLNKIDVTAAMRYLGARLNTIPEDGEQVVVVGAANIGSGGKAIDRTNTIPAEMAAVATRICKEIGAFICGVDFMYDVSKQSWHLIELNSSPSFGLHHSPSVGEGTDVTKLFVDRILMRYDQEH